MNWYATFNSQNSFSDNFFQIETFRENEKIEKVENSVFRNFIKKNLGNSQQNILWENLPLFENKKIAPESISDSTNLSDEFANLIEPDQIDPLESSDQLDFQALKYTYKVWVEDTEPS